MITLSRRLLLAGSIVVAGLAPAPGRAAAPMSAIPLDWAYYNLVILVLKDEGWLEEALKPQSVSVT